MNLKYFKYKTCEWNQFARRATNNYIIKITHELIIFIDVVIVVYNF